jgi:Eco57I restriction-modification methylase/TaqI-like C-terminal specificity domain
MGELTTNHYQALTTEGKLRGQYYTPDELVTMMLGGLHLTSRHTIVDPACGDGGFLRGAIASVARRFQGADPQVLARHWAGRLIGFDVDSAAVAEAQCKVQEAFREYLGVVVPPAALQIHQGDVLRYPRLAQLLRKFDLPGLTQSERLLIIGNPPYVEAKRLSRETKAALKCRYPDAVSGAPDLYLYFLHVCLGWLREHDTLAFVLPNKLLVNANARAIRERLLDEGRLRSLWFATRAGVFPEAAVYPIVLFGGGPGREAPLDVETAQIERVADREIRQGDPVTIAPGWYRRTCARAFFPPPSSPLLWNALRRLIEGLETARLDDVLDIRWTISFHRAGLRERYVLPSQPEDPCARRFLGGGAFSGNGEVTRYGVAWAGWWIRYAAAELQAEKNALPDPALFEQPKIVICQNGRTLRAAYDDQGFVLKDTFLCGVLRDAEHPLLRHPRALVGLLCSRAVHFFYSHVFYGGHVNGGYLHFLRSFMVDIPLGTWTDAAAEEVAGLVHRRETAAAGAWEELEEQTEARVAAALGLAQAERTAIAEWAARDANWQARERVRGPARGKCWYCGESGGTRAQGRPSMAMRVRREGPPPH